MIIRKITCGLAALALTLGIATQSFAGMQLFNESKMDLLMKRLEEKGLLTKEEIKAIEEQDKKEDKKNSVNLGVRLQLRGEYKENNGAERTSDLNVRRLRINLDGNAFPDVAYKFELHADSLSNMGLKDASLTFSHFGPYAKIRVGQFKTPFSRHRLVSSADLQMIDRSPIEKLYPGRDTGIEISGKNIGGVFEYGIAAEAGVGDNRKFSNTDNSEFWYDGRIAYQPFGSFPFSEGDVKYSDTFKMEVALNGLYAPSQVAFGERSIHDMFLADEVYTGQAALIRGIGTSTRLSQLPAGMLGDTIIWGPEITLRYKGASLTGEYFKASYTPDNRTQFRKIHSVGYFVQGGYFVIPKTLELTARFDRFDRNTEASTSSDTREYTAGINYFPFEDHSYKFQANYVWRVEDRNEIDNNSVVVNMQVKY